MRSMTTRFLSYTLAAVVVLAAFAALAGLPAAGGASPDITMTPSTTPSDYALLPIIRYDASPTPPPTPTETPFSAAAALYITPLTDIFASTFNTGSFSVVNDSLNGERLVEMRIDLSTAIFPDMVFDPFGTAGDTVAKDVDVDAIQGLTFEGRDFESPHDGGFDVLVLNFSKFDRDDRFEFSVDVDPTSITGTSAPGPFHSGSVGGLELVGATITATFDNGVVLVNQAYRLADSGSAGSDHSGALALMRPGLPAQPTIEVVGVGAPAVVVNPNQVARVSGPVGQPVIVLVVEGGLFTEGLPGGGFDLDPFEANSAITTREYHVTIGPAGFVDVPILLTRTFPEGGLNHITAVFDNHYGARGGVMEALVLELGK